MKRLKAIIDKAQQALSTCIFVFLILVLWHIAMALLGMQLFRCNPTEKHLCARANENATCPEYCSELVGDPPTCSFSDSEVFDHCPWDEKRNFNTFLQVCVSECVCTHVCVASEGWCRGRGSASCVCACGSEAQLQHVSCRRWQCSSS